MLKRANAPRQIRPEGRASPTAVSRPATWRKVAVKAAIILGLLASAGACLWILVAPFHPPDGTPVPHSGSRATSPPGENGANAVTFNTDIAPIIYQHCAVCHREGEVAPFPLVDFTDVRKRAEQIADVTESRYMPPWKPEPGHAAFVGERRLTDDQIQLIRRWVDARTPEGDPARRPAYPKFPQGWQLGEPDKVFRLPEPYTLPPEGNDVFRNFVIPAPVTGTRYVKAVEIRPGNAQVAHHGLLKIDRTSTSRRLDAADAEPGYDGMRMVGAQDPEGQFIVWTPGTTPDVESDEMCWRLERGTDLVLQLHLQPTGKPELVQPVVGLFFADTAPSRMATVFQLYSSEIDIAPGVQDYVVEDAFVLPVDVEVLGIFPHAHYIGKDIQAYAAMPDGNRRWLLHIKDWDFNWQDDYRYAQPFHLPAGAKIVMRYTYDNSTENPRNPSYPPKRVVAGDQSTDEMGSLTLRVLTETDGERLTLDEMLAREQLRKGRGRDPEALYALATSLQSQGRLSEAIQHYQQALRIRPNHALSHNNLGVLLKKRGDLNLAIHHYRQALAIDPEFADAYTNLGNALSAQGRAVDAVNQYRKALAIDPDSAGAHYNLAYLLQRIGRAADALPHYVQVIRLQPHSVAALNHAAWILATNGHANVRDGKRALQWAETACRLVGSPHHVTLNTLAAAQAEVGDFAKAATTAEQALDHARSVGDTIAAAKVLTRLKAFRARQPWRESKEVRRTGPR